MVYKNQNAVATTATTTAATTSNVAVPMSLVTSTGFAFAMLLVLVVIVIAIQTYKNANNVTTVATTTSNTAVPTSPNTSTGFVDTVVVGSAVVPGLYLTTANYDFTEPTIALASTPSAGSYGWVSYVGSIDFTAGYWMVNINNLISADQTSPYIANANGLTNLCNYQLFLCIDPNSTTIPGTSTPYSFATDGAYVINGGSTVSSTGTFTGDLTSSSLSYQSLGRNGVYTQYLFESEYSLCTMPSLITYVNVPSDITYYIMGAFLFSINVTNSTTGSTECPMICNIGWNATRLSNPIPETTLPYSSYFAPATATPTGSGASGVTVPTGAKATFYGGGYDQYY